MGSLISERRFAGALFLAILLGSGCSPTPDEEPEAAAEDCPIGLELGPDAFTALGLMCENAEYALPTITDCDDWADAAGATYPVVAAIAGLV
jgi:hypothetical protein